VAEMQCLLLYLPYCDAADDYVDDEELLMTDALLTTAIRTSGPTIFLQMVCKNTKDN
jgi:hypothetical protein